MIGIIGLIFVLAFLGVYVYFGLVRRKSVEYLFRSIPAFQKFQRAIGLSVEDGTRLHFSLGRGQVNAVESAVTFVGLRMLERVTRTISASDRPPVVTSGEGAITVLSQDTLQSTYRDLAEDAQYDPSAVLMPGPTPFAYAAGSIPIIADKKVSANLLVGHLGSEVALLTDAAERNNGVSLAGTDNLDGQAVLYAAADEPLIGEEVYVGGAYLQAGRMHEASVRTQDVFRWVVVTLLILGAVLKLLGLDDNLISILMGGS